jgi:hypothetical protein
MATLKMRASQSATGIDFTAKAKIAKMSSWRHAGVSFWKLDFSPWCGERLRQALLETDEQDDNRHEVPSANGA